LTFAPDIDKNKKKKETPNLPPLIKKETSTERGNIKRFDTSNRAKNKS